MGLDFIIVNPNAASCAEMYTALKSNDALKRHVIWNDNSIFGSDFEVPSLEKGQQFGVVCHPTVLSKSKDKVEEVLKTRKVVLIVEEAHKGFNCPDSEYTFEAFGAKNNQHKATWYDTVMSLDFVTRIGISATPLGPVYADTGYYKIISSYFGRDELTRSHKAVSSITLYTGNTDYKKFNKDEIVSSECKIKDSGYIETSSDTLIDNFGLSSEIKDKILEKTKWMESACSEYSLVNAKVSTIVQAKDSRQAHSIFFDTGKSGINSAIATSKDKKIYNFTGPNYLSEFETKTPNSSQIMQYVCDPETRAELLVANKLVGEAVNINNATLLCSTHIRSSNKNENVTAPVEQLLGRMNRWPLVVTPELGELKSWSDVYDYAELKVSKGVPKEVMTKWVDNIFRWDLHIEYSPANVSGLLEFFSKHTYNPIEWESELKRYKIDSVRKYSTKTSPKTPWAQEGDESYKKYRDENPQCEYCPKNEKGIPVCQAAYEDTVDYDLVTGRNEVHHIDGDHTNSVNSNMITLCPVVHHKFSVENNHYHNKKYRESNDQ